MVYYNADGHESSMCGNGGRCMVAFAKALDIISNSTSFEAIDGLHHATIDTEGFVHLQMQDVQELKIEDGYTFLDTGSPHHVVVTDNVRDLNVKKEGSQIRYSDLYGEAGSNINFVQQKSDDVFAVRTYERGVEDETLSCGTGVTAVALAMFHKQHTTHQDVTIEVEGGLLRVTFDKNDTGYTNIHLIGPAILVFKGTMKWKH